MRGLSSRPERSEASEVEGPCVDFHRKPPTSARPGGRGRPPLHERTSGAPRILNFSPRPADKASVNAPAPAPDPRAAKTAPAPGLRFVARQPILTKDEKVFGYELLFRDGIEDYFCPKDVEAASKTMLDSSLIMGLDVLCNGGRAFVNCTRDMLLKDYVILLPSSHTVVEILESVEPDDLVMAACQRLKEGGYMIALDDFADGRQARALTNSPTSSKLTCKAPLPSSGSPWSRDTVPVRCRMLAEKVETREEFLAAKKAGFAYFQGYFFRQPETMKTHAVPGNQLNYIKMLQVVSKPELEPREIENAIKGEASLCYRLLRYMNSANFGFSQRDPVSPARTLDSGRARSPALGAAGGHARRGTEQVRATWCFLPWFAPASANCCLPKSSMANPICSCWACCL